MRFGILFLNQTHIRFLGCPPYMLFSFGRVGKVAIATCPPRKLSMALSLMILLTSCSIGPKYIAPTASVPSTWNAPNKNTPATNRHGWWREFHDPLLNNLIEQEALLNLNIKMAQARIKTARADYAVAFAQLFPRLNADALPPNGTGFDLSQVYALTATLEPDFFGKQRQNRYRAQANLEAEQAEKDVTLLNLQAEIATSYLELREAQTKNKILHHNLQGNQQILKFAKQSQKAGLTNDIDPAQQEALIETQLADIEQNKANIMMIMHKIEILTGNNPGLLAKQLLPYKPVPQMTKPIGLGIPSELLRRRPDIIAAERRVAAAHANIRVAMANLFPQISIGWLMAWQTQAISSNIFALQDPESSFLATFTAPLINLSLYRIVDLRKREEALAVIQYELTVMKALHEVATQNNYCLHYQSSAKHLKRATDKKRLVLKLAKNTYEKGASDFNTLLRTEEDLNHLEMAYLHNVVIYQMAKINLYKALGGDVGNPPEK